MPLGTIDRYVVPAKALRNSGMAAGGLAMSLNLVVMSTGHSNHAAKLIGSRCVMKSFLMNRTQPTRLLELP